MYGYIRPNRGELRVREYERFQAVYCGLCRALGRRYGPLARFAVSYDLTFLALLLGRGNGRAEKCFCPAHPLRRRRCLCGGPALEAAADFSVILTWWKLADELRDGGFWTRLGARLGRFAAAGAYRRAR